jgi:hypothetical protein
MNRIAAAGRVLLLAILPVLLTGCWSSGLKTPAIAPTISIGGSITGLTTTGLVLANGTDTVTPTSGATGFTFGAVVTQGSSYSVSVQTQPGGAACSIANGSGTAGATAVTNVQVNCVASHYSVGGTISGLTGSGLVLANGSDTISPAANASTFAFPTQFVSANTYHVTVSVQPTGQSCAVTHGSGAIAATNVQNVQVSCSVTPAAGWTVGAILDTGTSPFIASVPGGAAFHVLWNHSSSAGTNATTLVASHYDDLAGWAPAATLATRSIPLANDTSTPANSSNLNVGFMQFDAQGNGFALGSAGGYDTDTSQAFPYVYYATYTGSLRYIAGAGWSTPSFLAQSPSGLPGQIWPAVVTRRNYAQTPTGLAVSPDGTATAFVQSREQYLIDHNPPGNCPTNINYPWLDPHQVVGMYFAAALPGTATANTLVLGSTIDPSLPNYGEAAFTPDLGACTAARLSNFNPGYPHQLGNMAVIPGPVGAWHAVAYQRSVFVKTGITPDGYDQVDTGLAYLNVGVENGTTYSEANLASWGPSGTVASLRYPGLQQTSGVAVGTDGTTLVVWKESPPSGGVYLYTGRYAPSSGWGPRQLLASTTDPTNVRLPIVELDANGNGLIVFILDGKNQYARYDGKTGTISTPAVISTASSNVWQLLSDSLGNAWLLDCPTDSTFSVRHFDAVAGTWSTPSLSGSSDGCGYPTMAIDKDGNPLIVWQLSGNIYYSRYR